MTATESCPGANVIVGTRGDAVPPCLGVESLIARGEPVAVISVDARSGGSARSYREIEASAAAAGRQALLVRPTVAVAPTDERSWKATLHARQVTEVVNAEAIKALCAAGVVAVCGADSVFCVGPDGPEYVQVDKDSFIAAMQQAIGGAPHLCTVDCENFKSCVAEAI